MKLRVVLKGLALIMTLALLGYLFKTSDLGNSVNEAWIDALVGSGVHLAPTLKLGLAIGLFLISGALGAYLYHRLRHGQSMDEHAALCQNKTEPHEPVLEF